MTEHKVTCDCCGKNITATDYMRVQTSILNLLEFCSWPCLEKYVLNQWNVVNKAVGEGEQ